MIPNETTQTLATVGTLSTVSQFKITDATQARILVSLSDKMYTKKELAFIREYSTNAADAHIVAEKPIADIVVTMPEMNGLAALEAIIAEDPAARIIMVSAIGQTSFIKQALSAGARDFIVKPFKEDQVLQAINHCFET